MFGSRAGTTALLAALSSVAGCATGYRESGYLIHQDGAYEEVLAPSELFSDGEGPVGEIRFHGDALDLDRNYLRYRLVVRDRYYTVHGPSDPTIRVPAGTYRIGVQGITVNTYVSGQRVEYAVPETVELTVVPGAPVDIVLTRAPGGRVRATVQSPPGGAAGPDAAPGRPDRATRASPRRHGSFAPRPALAAAR